VKKVTAVLAVYAIVVIASCIFWVWYAVSKTKLTVGGHRGNIHVAANLEKTRQDAEKMTDNTTKLTGGVTEEVKADGRVDDTLRSNDPY
jgi:hypothetical protein